MHFLSKTVAILALVLPSCGSEAGRHDRELKPFHSVAHGDIHELGRMINLTQIKIDSSQKVSWAVYRMGGEAGGFLGPSDFYLIACFKLQEVDSSKLTVTNTITQPLKKTSIYYKEWLPGNSSYLFETESSNLKIDAYEAQIFAKSPYLHGFFCVSKDKYLYLFMNTQ